jgi:leucyl/phenylalanyl-tRNA--protein transferase
MSSSPRLAWVEPGQALPDPAGALTDPNGLLAAGRDLSDERLLEAYTKGIFPWYSAEQPVLWWSPDPRMVLELDRFKASRSLIKTARRVQRSGSWTLKLNCAFERVMQACAAPRRAQSGTWIVDEMMAAYGALHRRGFAHSVEVRDQEDRLIGGLYGVAIGRMFYGESMFSRESDASKYALFALVRLLQPLGFRMIDCQQATAHLASLGGREISRNRFLETLSGLVRQSGPDWKALSIEDPEV